MAICKISYHCKNAAITAELQLCNCSRRTLLWHTLWIDSNCIQDYFAELKRPAGKAFSFFPASFVYYRTCHCLLLIMSLVHEVPLPKPSWLRALPGLPIKVLPTSHPSSPSFALLLIMSLVHNFPHPKPSSSRALLDLPYIITYSYRDGAVVPYQISIKICMWDKLQSRS